MNGNEGCYKTPGKHDSEYEEEVGVTVDRTEGMHLIICHHSGFMNVVSMDTMQSVFMSGIFLCICISIFKYMYIYIHIKGSTDHTYLYTDVCIYTCLYV
jgi:hypothetical protein